jgi:hypothetical protein
VQGKERRNEIEGGCWGGMLDEGEGMEGRHVMWLPE